MQSADQRRAVAEAQLAICAAEAARSRLEVQQLRQRLRQRGVDELLAQQRHGLQRAHAEEMRAQVEQEEDALREQREALEAQFEADFDRLRRRLQAQLEAERQRAAAALQASEDRLGAVRAQLAASADHLPSVPEFPKLGRPP